SIGAGAGTTLTLNPGAVSSALLGIADLTKVGPGTLTAGGNGSNTLAGNLTIVDRVVNVQNSFRLGLVTGSLAVNSGATLQLQSNVGGKAVTLNGSGFGNGVGSALGQGALAGQNNNSTWGGDVILGTGATLGAISGQTLFVGGIISGTDFTKVN